MDDGELSRVPNLNRIILVLLRQIPEGMVTSYKDIALALGDPGAARAVGTVLASNEEPEKYPCWRVVHSSGAVGKYSGEGGAEEKMRRMEAEGIEVEAGRVKDFDRVRFRDFSLDPPLPRLRKVQDKLDDLVELDSIPSPKTAAGLDISYGSAGVVAAYVEMEQAGKRVVTEETICRASVDFPYIPGYLAFRELPPLLELIRKVGRSGSLADLMFVDGNGLLHPRKAGLASHLGVVINHPTVGVAKKLLCGEVDTEGMEEGEKRDVTREGNRIGLAVRTSRRANPIYVSVGHRTELNQAGDLTAKFSTYKLPEPIRRAHRLAKSLATETGSTTAKLGKDQ